jgi:hypothetical protein
VFLAMLLTTLTFSPWFLVLTAAHLAIDILKTFGLPNGLPAYIGDQVLHILSIVVVVYVAPGLWSQSPLADVDVLPLIYLIAGGIVFAARGGQYAVLTLVAREAPPSPEGVMVGWIERAALCVVVPLGVPLLTLPIVAIKLVYMSRSWNRRDADARRRLVMGTAVSFAWGLAVAIPLAMLLPVAHNG